METYKVKFTGLSPIIFHQDNLDWQAKMKEWREIPDNKKLSVAGDDRSPAFTWLGSLYHDGEFATIPSDNIMRCLMEGGAGVVVPGGKNGKTFKAQTQSGMLVVEEHWLMSDPVTSKHFGVKSALKLANDLDFEKHKACCESAGYSLYVKRAKIGQSKHVRVRPRFERWAAEGTLQVWDPQLTLPVLRDIVKVCGSYKGLGDWRPSSKTPGPFGRFSATVEKA